MANAAFQVIVSTVDRSSPALAAIKRQLEGLSSEAMRVQVRTARLAIEAGALARVRSAIGGVGNAFGALRGHLGGAWRGRGAA